MLCIYRLALCFRNLPVISADQTVKILVLCIVPYFAEDRKDLEISKSSILKKKKEGSMKDFGPEKT